MTASAAGLTAERRLRSRSRESGKSAYSAHLSEATVSPGRVGGWARSGQNSTRGGIGRTLPCRMGSGCERRHTAPPVGSAAVGDNCRSWDGSVASTFGGLRPASVVRYLARRFHRRLVLPSVRWRRMARHHLGDRTLGGAPPYDPNTEALRSADFKARHYSIDNVRPGVSV
jgi:hypothetical protein